MKFFQTLTLFVFYIHMTYSQSNAGSKIRIFDKIAEINSISEINEHWNSQLKSFEPSFNKGPISEEELNLIRENAKEERAIEKLQVRSLNTAPNLGLKFESNRSNGTVPPDNSIAVSDNGHIISAVNANIWIGRADGKVDLSTSMADFFKKVQLSGGYFDPRVIFDHKYKRFIIVCLVGNTAATSHVVLAASKAEDPNLGFNFYKIKGDLEGDDLWFDYPNVGMTQDELFINGNMFTNEPYSFRYSMIFQIDKVAMFQGLPLCMKNFPRLTNVNGGIIFNCTPASTVEIKSDDNVAHFLSARSSGSSEITYCRIVGSLSQGSTYEAVRSVSTTSYQVAPLALMKNNVDKLQTNDCRIQHCIKLGNTIHFVLTSRVDTLAGIYVGRMDLSTNEIQSYKFSEPGLFCAYPGLAYLGKIGDQETFLVPYLRSNEEVYPEIAAFTVGGSGNEFLVSPSKLIREGDSAVAALTGNERWGDYSTACTRNNPQGNTEVWINACYGSLRFASYTAQFSLPDSAYYDFFPSKTVGTPGDTFILSFVGADTLSDIQFTVQGQPNLINQQSTPFIQSGSSFIIDSLGSFSAKMTAKKLNGDAIIINKTNIITVKPKVFAPITNFTAEKLVIFAGDSLQFQDLTENGPTEWNWSFSGGEPEKSNLANPKVLYAEKGAYNVLLNTLNEAGSQTKFRPRFITVKERPLAPIVNFSSDKTQASTKDTVAFFDLSENNPLSWEWLFTNGKDSLTSSLKNPKITFPQVGNYSVKLTVINEGGISTLTRDNFVTISTIVDIKETLLVKPKLYPNPSSDRVYLSFNLPNSHFLRYEIYDLQGQLIKTLLERNTKKGENEFSFSVEPLVDGVYTLRVVSESHFISQTFNFLVQK